MPASAIHAAYDGGSTLPTNADAMAGCTLKTSRALPAPESLMRSTCIRLFEPQCTILCGGLLVAHTLSKRSITTGRNNHTMQAKLRFVFVGSWSQFKLRTVAKKI